jgi:anti-sigma factor RsiW
MKSDPTATRLTEIAWRRPLNAAEAAELRRWLATHPEAAAEWEHETALSRAVKKLPDAAVPTNFTARVLAEAQRSEPAGPLATQRNTNWWWRVFLPRTAVAAALLITGVSIYRVRETRQQEALLKTVSEIARTQPPPPTLALEDYDVVATLSRKTVADDELLSLMQ